VADQIQARLLFFVEFGTRLLEELSLGMPNRRRGRVMAGATSGSPPDLEEASRRLSARSIDKTAATEPCVGFRTKQADGGIRIFGSAGRGGMAPPIAKQSTNNHRIATKQSDVFSLCHLYAREGRARWRWQLRPIPFRL
jgi:hypothetical protein